MRKVIALRSNYYQNSLQSAIEINCNIDFSFWYSLKELFNRNNCYKGTKLLHLLTLITMVYLQSAWILICKTFISIPYVHLSNNDSIPVVVLIPCKEWNHVCYVHSIEDNLIALKFDSKFIGCHLRALIRLIFVRLMLQKCRFAFY